jgi:hypothetical protein
VGCRLFAFDIARAAFGKRRRRNGNARIFLLRRDDKTIDARLRLIPGGQRIATDGAMCDPRISSHRCRLGGFVQGSARRTAYFEHLHDSNHQCTAWDTKPDQGNTATERSAPFIHAQDLIASGSADQSKSRVEDVRLVCAGANSLHLDELRIAGAGSRSKRNFSARDSGRRYIRSA